MTELPETEYSLSQKLKSLESRIRFLRRTVIGIVALLLVILAGLGIVSVRTPAPKIVHAGQFILLDAEGKKRATLYTQETAYQDEQGEWKTEPCPVLDFYNNEGNPHLNMSIEQGGGIVNIYARGLKSRVSLVASGDSTGSFISSLGLFDAEGRACGLMAVTQEGTNLTLSDGKKSTIVLKVGKNGPELQMTDKDGKILFSKP